MPQSIVQQFPFAAGIDEGSDPKLLPPGKLLTLKNCVWKKSNRVEKRSGTAPLPKTLSIGGNMAAGARLFTRGSELGLIDGASLWGYSPAAGIWERSQDAAIPEVGLTWSTILDAADGVLASDVALRSDGVLVHAWVSGDPTTGAAGNPFWQMIDRGSGNRTSQPVQLDNSSATFHVRVLTSGTNTIVLWNNGVNIYCSVNGAAGVSLRADAVANGAFDAMMLGGNFLLAYALAAGGIGLYTYTVASPPVQVLTGAVTGEAAVVGSLSIAGAVGESIYIGYSNATPAIRMACANPATLAQTLAPTNIDTTAGMNSMTVALERLDATHVWFCYSARGSGVAGHAYNDGYTKTQSRSNAGASAGIRDGFFLRILGRPFNLGGTTYLHLGNFGTAEGVFSTGLAGFTGIDTYLVALESSNTPSNWPNRYVGHIDVLIGGTWSPGSFCNVVAASATEALVVLPFLGTAPGVKKAWRQGCRLVSCTIGASRPADMWRGVQLGDEVYLAAGVLTAYDGRQAFDYGFAGPAWIDMLNTAASAAGGSMATGTYLYSTVPEYRSAASMLHRGPSCPTQSIPVTGPTGSVALQIVPVHLSQKSPSRQSFLGTEPLRVKLALYRSTANGAVPQRETVEPSFNVITQSPALVASFTDTRLDTNLGDALLSLATRPTLYTSGGELDDYQPPSVLTLCLHRQRIYALAGDKRTVWVSKDYSSNIGTAPGFHPTVVLPFPEDVTALCPLDDKLPVFSATSIWIVYGDGPPPNGQGATYEVIKLQSDVGCTNPRSVVGTPDGVMFLSARGIYLLSRKLELSWIGKAVQDRLAAFPNVTSAVLVAKKNLVRFTCNNVAGTAGIRLSFDYVTGQWSWDELYDTDAGVASTPIADAIMWNGTYTFLTPAGKVFTEDDTTCLDGGTTWVKMRAELAWISESGPAGFQHMRRAALVGDRLTDCDLTLSYAFDHAPTFAQNYTWRSDKLAQFNDGANVGMGVGSQNGAHRRCRAFRVAFEDAAPTGPGAVVGTGQGCNFSALGLEFVPKPGLGRRAARARA